MRYDTLNSPEILAPAGNMESLIAAVRAGADAVYLGGRLFSARAGAANFTDEQLKEAVEYCHARGVRVLLAVNTLLLEQELAQALRLIEYACTLPVDAVLVQDTGLLYLLRHCAPSLPLHASTQMSVHTPAGVRALCQAGLKRAVLAREMSLAQIREATDATPTETEVFAHGALCMSVSGQCWFSAMLGSRSGNRGQCAQPCRLPFSTPGGTGHDLSLKDLSLLSRLEELTDAGVASAKIEGRMKRPEYVAAAAQAFRLAANGKEVPPKLADSLGAVFSRSGFTTGYPDGELGRSMFGTRSKEDVTAATEPVFSYLRELYQNETPRIPVRFTLVIHKDKPVRLTVHDKDGHMSFAEGAFPEPARSRAVTAQRCEEQLKKTGGTPFFTEEAVCDFNEGLSIPVSLLNGLRRTVLEELLAVRAVRPTVPFTTNGFPPAEPHRSLERPLLHAFFHSAGQAPEEAAQCALSFFPCGTPLVELEQLSARGIHVGLIIPRGMFGLENTIRNYLKQAKNVGILDAWVGTLDGAQLAKELEMRVHGGFSLNMTNSMALQWYSDFGLEDTELSIELTLKQASLLGGGLSRGLVAYGRLPLMLCRNCPAANVVPQKTGERPCLHCKTAPVLTDRRGTSFPIECTARDGAPGFTACSEVLNSVPLYMADRVGEIKGMDFLSLRFTTETRAECARLLRCYSDALCGKAFIHLEEGGYTRGLYYRGIK